MKRLFMSAVFAMLLASPAFAQSYSRDFGTGNVINMPAAESSGGEFGAGLNANASASYDSSPYAYAPRHVRHNMRATQSR